MRIIILMMWWCALLTAQAAHGDNAPPAKAITKSVPAQSSNPDAELTPPPTKVIRSTPDPQQKVANIDSVVAVVNDDVITRYELDERVREVVRQLQKQDTPLPAADVLERQMLERMITDMLQEQYARENGVRVDDTQLNLAITRIAQQNNFPSSAEFRAKLEADGVDYKKFREEIRGEIISTRLREREDDFAADFFAEFL